MTTPQPSRQARSSGHSLSILMQLASLTTVWWANVPSAPMARRRSWPLGVVARRAVRHLHADHGGAPRSHRFWWPVEQLGQRPARRDEAEHDVIADLQRGHTGADFHDHAGALVTTDDGGSPVVPARSPVTRCSSLWHMPVAASLTSTSPGSGGSRSISSTLHGALRSHRIAAFVFTAQPQVFSTSVTGPVVGKSAHYNICRTL